MTAATMTRESVSVPVLAARVPDAARAAVHAALKDRARTRILAAADGIDVTAADPAPDTDALTLAARTATDRVRAAVLADARKRDHWHRIHAYRLDERALRDRCQQAAARACARAPEQDRDGIAQDLAVMVARRHGWNPVAADVGRGWLETRAAGAVLREQQRAARSTSAEVLSAPEASAERDRGSVWAAATGRTFDPARTPAAAAAESAGDALADRMDVTDAARLAIRAALAGWGSAETLSGALGISAAAARKRLQRGRDALREQYPTPAALADAVMDAQRSGAADPERVELDRKQRRALAVLDSAADVTAARRVGWRHHREPRTAIDRTGAPAGTAGGDWLALRKAQPESRPSSTDPHRHRGRIARRLARPSGAGAEPAMVGARTIGYVARPIPVPSLSSMARRAERPVPVPITTGAVPAEQYRPVPNVRPWWIGALGMERVERSASPAPIGAALSGCVNGCAICSDWHRTHQR